MSLRQLHRYLSFVPELTARESLDGVMMSAYPHLKSEARDRLLDTLQRQAKALPSKTMVKIGWDKLGKFVGKPGG